MTDHYYDKNEHFCPIEVRLVLQNPENENPKIHGRATLTPHHEVDSVNDRDHPNDLPDRL